MLQRLDAGFIRRERFFTGNHLYRKCIILLSTLQYKNNVSEYESEYVKPNDVMQSAGLNIAQHAFFCFPVPLL